MKKFIQFRSLEPEKITECLEKVFNGETELYMYLPSSDGLYLMPEPVWRSIRAPNYEGVELQSYLLTGGYYKLADGEAVAINLLIDNESKNQELAFNNGSERLLLLGWADATGTDQPFLTTRWKWITDSLIHEKNFVALLAVPSPEIAEGITPNLGAYSVNTPEFAAVLEVWEKYWADGKDGITKEALVHELVTEHGFTPVSAKAIDRVCRPEYAREGRRSKNK